MNSKVSKPRTAKPAAVSGAAQPEGAAGNELKKVQAITDGSCLGNPGPGGWACILRYGTFEKELSGGEPHTTNNRMELTAALKAMEALTEACAIEVVTDSEYLKNGVESWMAGWKKNGWMTKAKKPVLNRDLWEALDQALARHRTTWVWTKGHAGHADNNRCDELARAAAARFQGR